MLDREVSVVPELQLQADSFCFACGEDNPFGLHMEFAEDGEWYVSQWQPQPHHQGWHKILHGGLVSTLLDEVMTWRLVSRGLNVVTAEMTVRLKAPTPLDQLLTVRARVVSQRRRFFEVEGELRLPDGTVTATAQGKFMQVGEEGEGASPPSPLSETERGSDGGNGGGSAPSARERRTAPLSPHPSPSPSLRSGEGNGNGGGEVT